MKRRWLWPLILTIGFFWSHGLAYAGVLPGGFAQDDDPQLSHAVSGISAGRDTGECCWMVKNPSFVLVQPPDADRLRIAVFAPSYALPAGMRERVGVTIDGRDRHVCCVSAGGSDLVVALRRDERVHTLRVTLHFPYTFRPRDAGVGPDTRELTVLLRGVLFEDSTTGEERAGALEPPSDTNPLPENARLALIALGALIAFAAAFRRLSYGIAALLLAIPFDFSIAVHGTTLTFPKAVLVAVLAAVAIRAVQTRTQLGKGAVLIAGALALVALSMVASDTQALTAHAAIRETLKVVEYALAFAAVYLAYRIDPGELLVTRAFAIVTLAVVAAATIQLFTGTTQDVMLGAHRIARLAGPLGGPNQLAAFAGIAAPVLLCAWWIGRDRALCAIAFLAAALATIFSLSRGGILALAIGCGIVAVAYLRPRWKTGALWGAAALVTSLFALSVAVAIGHGPFGGALFGQRTDVHGGIGTRTLLWDAAIRMWRQHPWLGVGPGNFELRLYAAQGVRTHANSVYLNTLAEQGVFGLLSIVLLAIVPAALFARARTPLVIAALAASVALAVHQSVDTLWIYPKVGMVWMVLLALGAASIDCGRQDEQIVDLAGRRIERNDVVVAAP